MFHLVQNLPKTPNFHEVQKIHDYIKTSQLRIQSRLTESRFFYSFSPSSFSLVKINIYAFIFSSLLVNPSILVYIPILEDFLHVSYFSNVSKPREELGFLNFQSCFSINPYFYRFQFSIGIFNSQFLYARSMEP